MMDIKVQPNLIHNIYDQVIAGNKIVEKLLTNCLFQTSSKHTHQTVLHYFSFAIF